MESLGYINNEHLPRTRTFWYLISSILFFILAVSSIYPPIRAVSFFNKLWALCLIGWFATTILDNPSFLYNDRVHRLAIYGYIIYTIFVANLTGNGMIGNRFFELAQLPFFYIAYQNNKQMGRSKDNFFVLFALLPFLVITCLITIRACIEDPISARLVKKNAEGFELMRQGIGSYELIYFLVLVFCTLLFVVFNNKRKVTFFQKSLGIGLFILFGATIVLSNFMTALLLTTIGVLGRVFLNKITLNKLIIFPLAGLFLLKFSKDIMVVIIDFIMNLYGESMNAVRLLEIKVMLMENESGAAGESRAHAFNSSIDLLLENPVFGILTKPLVRVGEGVSGFGQHSFMLDTFALFGLGIGLLQLFIFTQPFLRRIKPNKHSKISSMALVFMVIFIILTFVNNLTPSIGLAAFFIFPTFYDWVHSSTENKNLKYVQK